MFRCATNRQATDVLGGVNLLQQNMAKYVEVTNKQFEQEDDFVKYQLAGTYTHTLSLSVDIYKFSCNYYTHTNSTSTSTSNPNITRYIYIDIMKREMERIPDEV